MNGAKYVSDSRNKKLMGSKKSKKIDATYISVTGSCPGTCPLKDEGCYAQVGPMGIHVKRLDGEVNGLSALQVARAEATVINESYGGGDVPMGRDLRIHVSGDCRTISGARIINKAIGGWKKRGGGAAWGYTHCWDHVTRDEWSNVSMMASVDSVDEVIYARQNGYAPALVVSEHPSERAYLLPGSDIKWIPCPAQTRHVGCVDCRLCMNADRLYESNMGITFSAHGVKKNTIKRRLNVVR
jgi:hypothetical protein